MVSVLLDTSSECRVRRWTPQLPTTLAGAELCGLIAFVGLRLVDLVQLAVAAPGGLDGASRPTLDAATMILFVAESVGIVFVVVRARRYRSLRLAILDTVVALVVLAAQPLFTAPTDRVGTWTAWGFAVTVGTALGIGIGFPRAWQTWAAATALAVTYLAVSLPDPSAGARSSAWSNAIAYFGFALIARGLSGYLRRMGRDADEARAAAERLGRVQEFELHRQLLHDQATILHLLSGSEVDDRLAGVLRGQAALGARQIRAFLGRDVDTLSWPKEGYAAPCALVTIAREVAAQFGDLPITVSVELAADVVLQDEMAHAVRGALSAVLHNVRLHAAAQHVTLHADHNPRTLQWELSVTDDGAGFETTVQSPGYGLTHQVAAALAEHAIEAQVRSAPGAGTVVTMRRLPAAIGQVAR